MKKTPFFHSASSARFLSRTAAPVAFVLAGCIFGTSCIAGTPVSDDTPSATTAQTGHFAAFDWQNRTPFIATAAQTVQKAPVSGKTGRKTAHRKTARQASPAVIHAAMQTSGTTQVSPGMFSDETVPVQSLKNDALPAIRMNTTENPADAARYATPMQKGYAVGPARFSVNYEKANDKSRERTTELLNGKATYDIANSDLIETPAERDNLHLGMEYDTGNGRVNAAMNLVRIRDPKSGAPSGNDDDSADLRTFTIGYTYDASDTTSFYGMVAHTDYDSDALRGYGRGDTENDSVTGFQVGVTHRF